jgi:hypothetical protein
MYACMHVHDTCTYGFSCVYVMYVCTCAFLHVRIECTSVRRYAHMDGLDGRVDGWMDGWIDGWMDGCGPVSVRVRMFV